MMMLQRRQRKEEGVEEKSEERESENEENEDHDDCCFTQEAMAVFERFMGIDCPFLESLYITEPKTINQLLCISSLYHLAIPEWIFTQIFLPFKESFATLQEWQLEEKNKSDDETRSWVDVVWARWPKSPKGLYQCREATQFLWSINESHWKFVSWI